MLLSWSFFNESEIVKRSKILVRKVSDLKSTYFGRICGQPHSKCHFCFVDDTCPGHWGHIVLAAPVMHPIAGVSTYTLPVCPLNMRPAPAFGSDIYRAQHVTTKMYTHILKMNDLVTRDMCTENLKLLQTSVDNLFGTSGKIGAEPFISRLKGKHGRMRQNILGKRVNFSARSVIVGDPDLNFDQVGVPLSIAQQLLILVTVTDINKYTLIKQLEDAERNDTLRYWKGMPNGWKIDIPVGTQLLRPLRDHDIVILNRQPTLHKLSMLAFYVKIVPWSTIRIPPIVTKGFNADFDGDEMNIFAASTPQAQAEMKILMHIQQHKYAIAFIHDTKLEHHLGTTHVDTTDFKQRINMLNTMRLRGFSVGWKDALNNPCDIQCGTLQNVHNVKNKIMMHIQQHEPRDSPFRLMIEAKSKGNWSNLTAIKGSLGQQFIDGQIPTPITAIASTHRTQTGYIHSSYSQGLTQPEFFFHCMAGRGGLIDTAIKTADAGYTHRRIARSLEDLQKHYDESIRDEHRNIIAFPNTPAASIGQPGTFAGIEAAQHIGEPATQLTLNTFHSSGALNEITTTGLKRLNQLIRWTKQTQPQITTINMRLNEKQTWILRFTTLNTFIHPNKQHATHIHLDPDKILLYDTDIQFIARRARARIISITPPIIQTTCPTNTHITGFKHILAVNTNGTILHDGPLPHIIAHAGTNHNPWFNFQQLGIEAARASFIRQIKQVLPQVKQTYIELLADSSTYKGSPRPLQFSSFKDSNTIKAAAFERAQHVFPQAAKQQRNEHIAGISEFITFNQYSNIHMHSLIT